MISSTLVVFKLNLDLSSLPMLCLHSIEKDAGALKIMT